MMQYYFPFKTQPVAVIKSMWSMCLNPFQEARWGTTEKRKALNQNCTMYIEQNPRITQRQEKAPCQVGPHSGVAESGAGR